MLTPLESDLFSTVAGLPLHPLIVHFAVVLLPLAGLALVLLVIAPRLVGRYGWLSWAGLIAGTGAAFLAKASGESLAAQVGEPAAHARWGTVLPWIGVALIVVSGLWLRRMAKLRDAGGPPRLSANLLRWGSAALAVAVVALTVVVGHSGAAAAWGDLEDDRAPAPETSISAAPSVSPPASEAASEPSLSSATPATTPAEGSYSMAEVAEHNSASSCWAVVNGTVYDLTDWIGQHPGGEEVIRRLCGTDASAAFEAQHGGQSRPETELARFRIGTLQ